MLEEDNDTYFTVAEDNGEDERNAASRNELLG